MRVSASSKLIRPLTVEEMALSLNLPKDYMVNTNACENKKRIILGSAFGVGSIAHAFKSLA